MIGVHLGSCCTDVGEGGLRRCRFEREREKEGRVSRYELPMWRTPRRTVAKKSEGGDTHTV